MVESLAASQKSIAVVKQQALPENNNVAFIKNICNIIKRVALFKLSLLLKNNLQRTQELQLILIGDYLQK